MGSCLTNNNSSNPQVNRVQFLNHDNGQIQIRQNSFNSQVLPSQSLKKTIVIINDLALRKNTLTIKMLGESNQISSNLDQQNRQSYFLTFEFDAYIQAKVSLYLLATEKYNQVSLKTDTIQILNGDERFQVEYLAKNNLQTQQFPLQNITFLFNEYNQQIFEKKQNFYPVIIKLEKISLNQDQNNKFTDQKCLYYYCSLEKVRNSYQIKVEKEKIEINGQAYIVQEIYGIDESGLQKQSDQSKNNLAKIQDQEKECIICFSEFIDTIILPCRHMCICIRCAQELQKSTLRTSKNCPVCRKDIESFLRLQKMQKHTNQQSQQ